MSQSIFKKHASHFGDMLSISDPEQRKLWLTFVKNSAAVVLGDAYNVSELMKYDASEYKDVYAQYSVFLYDKTKNKEWLSWAHKNDFFHASVPYFHQPILYKSAHYDDIISIADKEKNLFLGCLNSSRVAPSDLASYETYVSGMIDEGFVTPETLIFTYQFGLVSAPMLSLLHQWPKKIQDKLVLGEWNKEGLDIGLALMVANNILPSAEVSLLASSCQSSAPGIFSDMMKKIGCSSASSLKLSLILSGDNLHKISDSDLTKILGHVDQKNILEAVSFLCMQDRISEPSAAFFSRLLNPFDNQFRKNIFLTIATSSSSFAASLSQQKEFLGIFQDSPSDLVEVLDEEYSFKKNENSRSHFWDKDIQSIVSVLGDDYASSIKTYLSIHLPGLRASLKDRSKKKESELLLSSFSLKNGLVSENRIKPKTKL